MKSGLVAVVLVAAVLVGAGVGFLVSYTNDRLATSTSTSVVTSETTFTVSEWDPYMQPFSYVTTAVGCSSNAGYGPCVGSPAYVFNSCLSTSWPATPQTCTFTLKLSIPPYASYMVNITLGLQGQASEPGWANCKVTGGIGFADCISVINSTAFIVGVQALPPL